MSVNFTSGVCPGQSGKINDPYINLTKSRMQKDEAWMGGECSMHDYLMGTASNADKELNRMERCMGYSKGSLSWGRSVTNLDDKDSVLFVDSAGTFAQVDFDFMTYEIKTEREITSSFCDWSHGRPYDGYTVDQGGFTFYQLFSSGLGDGKQDSIFINQQRNDLFTWGLTSFLQIEASQY